MDIKAIRLYTTHILPVTVSHTCIYIYIQSELAGRKLGALVHRSYSVSQHLAVVALVVVVLDGVEPLEAELLGQSLTVVGREDGVGYLGLGHTTLASYLSRHLETRAHEILSYAVTPVSRIHTDVEDLQGMAATVLLV